MAYSERRSSEAQWEISRNVWENCEERKSNTIRVNDYNAALAEIERTNKFIDEEVRAKRIAVYGVTLDVPDCGERP